MHASRTGATSRNRILWYAVTLAPLLFLLGVVAQCRLNFPFADQWDFAPLVVKSQDGTLTFADLWAQHNEHRILFPKIAMLVLARLTSWNIDAEIALNVALGIGLFAVMLRLLTNSYKALGPVIPAWMAPLVACLALSCTQTENWVWGWQCQMLMSVFAVVAGVLLLQMERFSAVRFAAAIAAGVAATFSFANGIVYWLALMPSVLLMPCNAAARRKCVVVWLVSTATVASLYLHGYKAEPKTGLILAHPVQFVLFALTFLGSPGSGLFSANASPAVLVGVCSLIGVIGVTGFIVLVVPCIRHRPAVLPHLAPYMSLGMYALGSALMAAVGRVGHVGAEHAAASRYATFANPLWFACLAMLALAAPAGRWKPSTRRFAWSIAAIVFLVQQVGAVYCARTHCDTKKLIGSAAAALRAGSDDPMFMNMVGIGRETQVAASLPQLRSRAMCGFGIPRRDPRSESVKFTRLAEDASRQFLRDLSVSLHKTAVMLDPENVRSLAAIAGADFEREDWSSARQHLETCIRIEPENASYRANLGVVLGRLGRHGEAFQQFERARTLAPNDALIYVKEAALRTELRQFDQARELLAQAARLDPSSRMVFDAQRSLSRAQGQ